MADVEKLASKVSHLWSDAIDALEELVKEMEDTHPSVYEDYAQELYASAFEMQSHVEDMASAIADLHDDDDGLYERLEGWGKL